jgi:flavin reductase (DIM6/NTAB) family NADH-FMN oxidoreductase RutF
VTVDGEDFRKAMRCLAGAVTIVATGSGDERSGLTATAVCSFSLAPPRLLACVNVRGATFRLIATSRCMSVNVLSRNQESLARRFAGMLGNCTDDHFKHAAWRQLVTGAPVLTGTLAAFDCSVDEMFVAQTHAILIGEVKAVLTGHSEPPLLYLDGQFTTTAEPSATAPLLDLCDRSANGRTERER